MKSKHYIYLVTLLTVLITVGCNEDDFLTEVNPNATTTTTFWKTEKQFNSALTTVYGALQFQSVSGGQTVFEMIMGDIAGTESWYPQFTFRNLTFNDGTYYVTDKWNELYIGIFRANQVIQFIQDAEDANFSGDSKAQIEAQARFLRAFYYFQLAHSYGGAVIHTAVAENDEDLYKPFSTIDEVTDQVILPDLQFAKANLPMEWTSDGKGRATWGSATSLLGKTYLYGENWTEAANQFKEVIESGVYGLTLDVMDNYTHLNENNRESIFEVAYSAELNPGTHGDAVDDNPNESGAEASAIAVVMGQLNFGGFNALLSSYFLHELFVNDEVDPSNPINDVNLQSRRMTGTIAPSNGEGLYYGLEFGARPGWAFGQSAYVKKHSNWYHLSAENSNNRSGINFRHIRLADVYLMYAEAVINASGDYQTAIEYIDLVRARAGVKTLQQYMDENGGQFPALHISKQVHGTQPLVSADANSVMTHIRRVERPLELCFEGHRWKDLVRWGIVEEVYTELRADEIWRFDHSDELDLGGDGVPPLYIREHVRPDFNLAIENYTPESHDYFPIPTQEVQTNPFIN